MVALMVGGYLLTRPSDSYSAQETASKIGFHHQQKYQEIHSGSGTQAMSGSVQGWQGAIANRFDLVSQRLEEAAKKAGVTWEGAAAEAHGDSVRPLTSYVDDAKQVSQTMGDYTGTQVDNFASVRDTMPEPKKVTATDSLLEKGGAALLGYETDLQQQEQEAMQRAQEAQRLYENYEGRSSNVTTSLPHYAEAPKLHYSGNGGAIASNQPGIDSGNTYSGSTVNSGNYSGTGSGTGSGSGSEYGPGSGPGTGGYGTGPGGSDGSGAGNGPGDTDPAGSGSAGWAPPAAGGPAPAPGYGGGYGNVGTGPDGVVGGVYGSGGGGGRSGSGGGRGGGGRAGSGGGRSGGNAGGGRSGSGTGGRGNALGSGGRSGSGTPSPSARPATASSSSSSSSTAGRGMAPMRGGQQQDGGEDEEHERKFMVDTDDAWADLDLPPTAPPVIGEDLEQPRRRDDDN